MTPELILRKALANVTAKIVYEKNWNDPTYAGKGAWQPKFVMLHHTAGSSSLGILLKPGGGWLSTAGKPVRGSHVLIDRDGTVHVLTCMLAYHAGVGGPKWGIAAGAMNHYAWGIEIEDPGRSQTMTPAQIKSAAQLSAGLLAAEDRTPAAALVQHREWNPTGKTDTRYPTEFWRDQVAKAWPQVTTVTVPKPIRKTLPLKDWPIGKSVMAKVGAVTTPNWVTIPGGMWVSLAIIDLPAGARFGNTFQVRMPRGVAAGEARLGRLGWGTAGPGGVDDTGQNPIAPATLIQAWRTPIEHPIDGGGPLAFQVYLPPGKHKMRFVAKAYRIS